MKNALDWLVASGELYEKPVALFSASPRGRFAQASLIETLMVMMARLIPEAFVNVSPHLRMGNGELQVTATADLSTRVERALAVFAKAIDLPYSESKFASVADQDHRDQKPDVNPGVQN